MINLRFNKTQKRWSEKIVVDVKDVRNTFYVNHTIE